MTRIKASRNHQAPTILEPHLNGCTSQCPSLHSRLRQLHFYKRRFCCFPHSSLPVGKLGLSHFPIPAKRRYTLPALLLLGNQVPPLRPGLLSTLIHAPSLPQSALVDKMGFRYRSPCFDKISHDWLLANVPTDRTILQKWLKSGYMDKHVLHETTEGTPQGGIVSPALANCALDGLERLLRERFPEGTRLKSLGGKSASVNFIRYADDCVPRARKVARLSSA